MSLEGNLSAFGLSEILQLVAVQQKSGMLAINSHDRSKVLFFHDGLIMSTRDRRRRAVDPLKDYFVRYGIISREDIIRLTNLSKQSKLDLTDVIVSEGILTEEEMIRHCLNQVQETVHGILTWEQGNYKFIPGHEIIDGLRVWGEYSIEGLLMESMRRIDEFPGMVELFPSSAMRVSRKGKQSDGEETKVDGTDVASELPTNGKTILALLDKPRTVNALISRARMPKYETYEALKHLHDKGLIEASEPVETDAVTDINTKKKRRRPRRNPVPVVAAIILFMAALAWGGNDIFVRTRGVINSGIGASERGQIARNRVESKLRWTIESYRAQYGAYPTSLEKLTRDGLTPESLIKRADALEFRYHLTAGGDSYTLL